MGARTPAPVTRPASPGELRTIAELRHRVQQLAFDLELQAGYGLDLRTQFNAAVACLLRETGRSIEEVTQMVAAQTAVERSKRCDAPSRSSPS